jgi:hypothetical protein
LFLLEKKKGRKKVNETTVDENESALADLYLPSPSRRNWYIGRGDRERRGEEGKK